MCLAIPGKVIDIQNQEDLLFQSGRVSFSGIIKDVNLSLVPDVKQGDYVLVHVGVAVSVIDEVEAKKTMDLLEQMGELDELKDPE